MIHWEEEGVELVGRGPQGESFRIVPVFTAHAETWEAYASATPLTHVRLCHRATRLEAERACLRHLAQRQLDRAQENPCLLSSESVPKAAAPRPRLTGWIRRREVG